MSASIVAPAPAEDCVPVLLRGVRLHHDRVRGRWVLLAPERTIDLDPIAHAILSEVDGVRTFASITERLADRYDAPRAQISEDAGAYLTGLADRRMLDLRP